MSRVLLAYVRVDGYKAGNAVVPLTVSPGLGFLDAFGLLSRKHLGLRCAPRSPVIMLTPDQIFHVTVCLPFSLPSVPETAPALQVAGFAGY